MTNLASAIDHFESDVLNVARRAPSVLGTNGLWSAGAITNIPVQAVVVPITGRQLEALPEGWRTREPVTVYAKAALFPLNESTQADGDRFARNGLTYEVQTVQDWSQQGGFWVAVALKVTIV